MSASQSPDNEGAEGPAGEAALRLFVALELPEAQRELIVRWQREQLDLDALRPVARENLHVTLAFLGATPARELPGVKEAIGSLRGTGARARFLPDVASRPRRRPRLFALELESSGAVALADEIGEALRAACDYEPPERSFWPHVTVARVSRGARRPPIPGPLPDALAEPFECVRVALYRSVTHPQGARYERIAGVELPSPAQPGG